MEIWLNYVKEQPEQAILESPELLAGLFTLDLSNPQVSSIQASLASLSEQQIVEQVEHAHILDDEWPGLTTLAKQYLLWCAFVDSMNPQQSFVRYANLYLALQPAYANNRGSCLNLVVKQVVTTVTQLFGGQGKEYLEWIAAGVFKLFNAVRSEREPPSKYAPSKRENALFYANTISRAYFKSGQFVSAGNVFNNMHSISIAASQFSIAEQVTYRFWLGRYYLYKNDVENAFIHLNWAYYHALSKSPQQWLILDWLLVPSILVGRIPNLAVLDNLPLSRACLSAVNMLVTTVKSGQLPQDYETRLLNNEWIISRNLRPTLETHLPLLVYRSGLLRLLKLSGLDKLPLKLVQFAFHLSPQSDPQLLLTESICETLISKGMVKGNILPVSQMLVVKAQGSIRPLLEINQVLTRQLPSSDQWLNH